MAPVVKKAIDDERAQNYFRYFDRQSFHAHEVGIHDNLVFWRRRFISRCAAAVLRVG
jgi:hypothetical protein